MIHIVFGPSEAGSLKMAFKKLKGHQEEKIVTFHDIFSFGPIKNLHTPIGQEERIQWLISKINNEFDNYQQEWHEMIHAIHSISKEDSITIWIADNAHEQVGLRFALYLLQNKKNQIYVMNTTKTYEKYFYRPEMEYTVLRTGELSPEQLQIIYENERINSLTIEQRKVLENEWLALADYNENLRIWNNEKIESVREDFYDSYIIDMAKEIQLERASNDFMKSARLIGAVIGYLEQYVGDSFFEYRLRKLIEEGIFEMEGELKAMRFYSIRLKE